MITNLNIKSRLKDARKLTGVQWGVSVYLELGGWRLKDACHLSKRLQSELLLFLERPDFISKMSGVLTGGRFNPKVFMDGKDFGCSRIYAFPLSTETIVIVGTDDIFNSRSLSIWKLAVIPQEPKHILTADQDIGLLQLTVIELQQTQQELQARISAQHETEARLIQSAKLAAVGEMAAGVAHELNNPLTSVVGFTELALDELPVDSTVRSDLELILKEALRARSVVRRLLDFARQTETVRVKADINEIVDDVFMLMKHLMRTSKVIPEMRMGENLPWISVDRNQIKQVVINLVNNALYAMPEGGKIEIETQEQIRYGRKWVRLSIQDSGIGISPENLERIFEPFFTTRGDRGGTGLGLSVTYGIITDHDGMIEVESQLRVGSTFNVWLPLDQVK